MTKSSGAQEKYGALASYSASPTISMNTTSHEGTWCLFRAWYTYNTRRSTFDNTFQLIQIFRELSANTRFKPFQTTFHCHHAPIGSSGSCSHPVHIPRTPHPERMPVGSPGARDGPTCTPSEDHSHELSVLRCDDSWPTTYVVRPIAQRARKSLDVPWTTKCSRRRTP